MEPPPQCHICFKWFNTPRACIRHLNKEHAGPEFSKSQGKFPCYFCCETFTRRTNLKRHQVRAHGETHSTPTPILVEKRTITQPKPKAPPIIITDPTKVKFKIVYAPQKYYYRKGTYARSVSGQRSTNQTNNDTDTSRSN